MNPSISNGRQKVTDVANSEQQPNHSSAVKFMIYFTIIVVSSALIIAIYWFMWGRFRDSTDDAYVHGNIIYISPQIEGIVTSVNTDNMRYVKEGQILLEIDKTDYQIAYERAYAILGQTVRDISKLFEEYTQSGAELMSFQAQARLRQIDYDNRKNLVNEGAVSKEEFLHAKLHFEEATANVDAAAAKLKQIYALIQNTTIATHPRVLKAASDFKESYVNLQRCLIKAPTNGIVSQRSAQVGSMVKPTEMVMAIVPLNQIWVEANYREVDVAQIRIGQRVKITSDLYGSGVVFNGKVVGIDGGTGAAFSIIPPQNATGNWIKIVQRVPVRIDLDPSEIARNPLRIGLSLYTTIDTKEQFGLKVPEAGSDLSVYHTNVYSDQEKGVEEIIRDVIMLNAFFDIHAYPKWDL